MPYNGGAKGYIHSIETCGTVDGPGIRYVVFFQGCPLRCAYCHNPDTWNMADGKPETVEGLMSDIRRYRNFMRYSGGGVTASGGEPLTQHGFVRELFKACRAEGIHTALDTSGYCDLADAAGVLEFTDLLLLDIKSYNPGVFKAVTGRELSPTLELLKLAAERGIAAWVRYVLVPGLTDDEEDVRALGRYIRGFQNIEKVEVLPFHKMGEYKWDNLGYEYRLRDAMPPEAAQIERVKALLVTEE